MGLRVKPAMTPSGMTKLHWFKERTANGRQQGVENCRGAHRASVTDCDAFTFGSGAAIGHTPQQNH